MNASTSMVAGRLTTVRQLNTVAAARARRFFPLARNTSTSAYILGWCALPSLWPINMAIASGSAGKIRILRSASMQLDRKPSARPKPRLLICGIAAVIMWGLVIDVLLVFTPSAGGSIHVLLRAALVILALPFLLQFLAVPALLGLAKLFRPGRRRPAEGRMSALKRRRTQLTEDGYPAYIATWLCAGRRRKKGDKRKGDGQALTEAMITEWAAVGEVAIGWPANQELAEKYIEWGAHLDAGCTRRVLFGKTDGLTAA